MKRHAQKFSKEVTISVDGPLTYPQYAADPVDPDGEEKVLRMLAEILSYNFDNTPIGNGGHMVIGWQRGEDGLLYFGGASVKGTF